MDLETTEVRTEKAHTNLDGCTFNNNSRAFAWLKNNSPAVLEHRISDGYLIERRVTNETNNFLPESSQRRF